MRGEKILIVDDEVGMRNALREVIGRLGFQVELAEDALQALKIIEEKNFDLVLSDVRMPEMDGMTFLLKAKERYPDIRVVMMTAYGTIEDAVEAMKRGAMDYLLKPFSLDTVENVVLKCLEQEKISQRKTVTRKNTPYFVAESQVMFNILHIIREISPSSATVLLEGESGTGKEVLARLIHQLSGRGQEPFVPLNCAAIPEGLLESELFGYEKGSFTGAIISRKGKFEQSNRGTILLDEISEMPPSLQAKLLRVIQEKEIDPIGGKGTVPIDVRIIATTNKNLEKELEKGRFREDLFYRLNVINIKIPPLRERPDDIIPLAEYFLQKYCILYSRPRKCFSEELKRYILKKQWKGNVREIENFIERAVLLCKDEEITPRSMFIFDVPANLQNVDERKTTVESNFHSGKSSSIKEDSNCTLEEMERSLILSTLKKVNWNRTKAAEILGVSVRTIRNKIHQYGIEIAQQSESENSLKVIEYVR